MDFMAIRDEAHAAVELLGRLVVADHGQLNEFDPLARMAEHRQDELSPDAGATRRGPNVHAPEIALVSLLCPGLRAVAGHTDEIGVAEGTEDVRVLQSLFKLTQRSRALLLERAAEGFGRKLQRFQPDLPKQGRVSFDQTADLDSAMICHCFAPLCHAEPCLTGRGEPPLSRARALPKGDAAMPALRR